MEGDITLLVGRIDRALRAGGDPERAEREASYLKSSLVHYGTGVPATRAVVRAVLGQAPGLAHREVVELVELLWDAEPPVHERRLAAVEVLVARHRLLGVGDASLLERLVRQARTWALVDPVATGVVGPLVQRDPDWGTVLDAWAGDGDLWVRRTALLALLVPLRRGGGDWERFARYADAMLDEREFFIGKAIGWVLRDTAKRRPDLVAEWLLPRAGRASGVTVREAVKPLSPAQRAAVLAARSTR